MKFRNMLRRLRARRKDSRPEAATGQLSNAAHDEETGEILQVEPTDAPAPPPAAGIPGDRGMLSVNRERSLQSRITLAMAAAIAIVLVGGFIAWYYLGLLSHAGQEEAAERKTQVERAGSDAPLPPIGHVDPPAALAAAPRASPPTTAWLPAPPAPDPAPATTRTASNSPPPKTPEELTLERQLGAPVIQRANGQSERLSTTSPAAPPNAALALPIALSAMGSNPSAALAEEAPTAPPTPTLDQQLRPSYTPAVSAQRLPDRHLLLPKGTSIDCTLETAIDSTFDGMVLCIGATDVYSADGKVVLLERGTRYVGEKRGEARLGQSRVFVLWNEARTPDGVSVALASPGTDALGRAGQSGQADNHFWDRFGAALLISFIDGSLQALSANRSGGNGNSVVIGTGGVHDVMTEVLKSTVAIPPTVVVHQGARAQILVARDVDFRGVYDLRARDGAP
jgi:type IV secretion system protein VirB10